MSTNMTEALKDAGIQLPTVQRRIWDWIKDHPDANCESIKNGLNTSRASISPLLSQMHQRKMLVRAKSDRTGQFEYRVAHKEFVLLPLPKDIPERTSRSRTYQGPAVAAAAPEPAAPTVSPQDQARAKADALLADMPLLVGRALLQRLSAIFNVEPK